MGTTRTCRDPARQGPGSRSGATPDKGRSRRALAFLTALGAQLGSSGCGGGARADAGHDAGRASDGWTDIAPSTDAALDVIVPLLDATADALAADGRPPPADTPPADAASPTGIAAAFPGDRGLGAHRSVLFFEDFEEADVAALTARWDSTSVTGAMRLTSVAPAGAVAGSRSLGVDVPAGAGTTGVTLFKSLPTQQGSVYVRYYVQYADPANYHHTGMFLGGFNPPTRWPQGTAGIRPSGTDFFQNAFEPQGGALTLDHYAQWPGMDCWMPSPSCYGNNLLRNSRPTVAPGEWHCVELMVRMNTPGASDGEYAVWMDDRLVQRLRPGEPRFVRSGTGWWTPDPSGTPFPGFNWRSTSALGFNWIWLNFYVDRGPSSIRWDQTVVATERVGCMAPSR